MPPDYASANTALSHARILFAGTPRFLVSPGRMLPGMETKL